MHRFNGWLSRLERSPYLDPAYRLADDIPRAERLVSQLLGRRVERAQIPSADWEYLLLLASDRRWQHCTRTLTEAQIEALADRHGLSVHELMTEAEQALSVLTRWGWRG